MKKKYQAAYIETLILCSAKEFNTPYTNSRPQSGRTGSREFTGDGGLFDEESSESSTFSSPFSSESGSNSNDSSIFE